jgi:hypothetical protein
LDTDKRRLTQVLQIKLGKKSLAGIEREYRRKNKKAKNLKEFFIS